MRRIARSEMDKFIIRKRKHEGSDVTGGKKPSKLVNDKMDQSKTSTRRRNENNEISWKHIQNNDNLNCDYCILFSKQEADELFQKCEDEIEYYTGDLTQVKVYGKWHNIPRKQVAYGESGLRYTFSGTTVPAKPWTKLVDRIREKISLVTGHHFNFVLINRYKDGNDHMGEHRDDEKELDPKSPIASLSLGQHRDFVFKHCDSRGKNLSRKIDPVKIELEHGSLLLMNHPTNVHWYHSLPIRKKALCPRINMTFRKMLT
ncbi:DNA oxidative demethylase ALKBH2-like [Tubulanus polymorphus]|uniref:DNA oxidative demethylase ALKBH2-like n=1 Tax=Tubulanus polymorphus TaxID=672921 RepID=UPI003DA37C11